MCSQEARWCVPGVAPSRVFCSGRVVYMMRGCVAGRCSRCSRLQCQQGTCDPASLRSVVYPQCVHVSQMPMSLQYLIWCRLAYFQDNVRFSSWSQLCCSEGYMHLVCPSDVRISVLLCLALLFCSVACRCSYSVSNECVRGLQLL